MKDNKISMIALIIMLLLAGCSTWNKFNDTEKGAVIGGGTGAAVGNAIAPGVGGAVVGGAAGALGGGLIGNEIQKNKNRRHH